MNDKFLRDLISNAMNKKYFNNQLIYFLAGNLLKAKEGLRFYAEGKYIAKEMSPFGMVDICIEEGETAQEVLKEIEREK